MIWVRERHRARGTRQPSAALVAAALVAGLLPAIFPLEPGYRASDTAAMVVAAALAATGATALIPLSFISASRSTKDPTRQGLLVLSAALLSAGAAAIHLAVAKVHFDEYALFGVFFVASGVAQLAWGLWLTLRPSRGLLLLGAVGNAPIVGLWALTRTAGLPLGPEHWKPEAVGFADVSASSLEALLVICCLGLLVDRDSQRPWRLGVRPRATFGMMLAVAVVTTLGLLSALGVASSLITPSA